MKSPYEHFKSFSKIDRCSLKATPMKEFLINFGENLGYEIKTDKAGNVLCSKGEPVLCLQSHYDMVCIGEAPNAELYEEEGWLKAKNSTLGADNGIGVAIMLSMMEKFNNIECLFTADEEVGLIGANNMEIELKAPYLLNLDSEEEGAIIIGCAGGINIIGEIELDFEVSNTDGKFYKIETFGFAGGHSGLKIVDNIPSAIKTLVYELVKIEDCELVDFSGGEVSNSIPKNAVAVIKTAKKPEITHPNIKVEEYKSTNDKTIKQSKNILGFINSFAQGVRAYNQELDMPNDSINLGTVKIENGVLQVDCFARSMSDEGLDILKSETTSLYIAFGFNVSYGHRFTPWKIKDSEFSKIVSSVAGEFWDRVTIKGVHAGLECGVIQATQKRDTQVVAIGPNITGAHSLEEKCELASVDKVTKIIETLIIKLQK
jgi:dipeptidase D